MAWFRKQKKPLTSEDRRDLPSDVFEKCAGCGEIVYREKLAQNDHVCPTCDHHFRVGAERYLRILSDEGYLRRAREVARAVAVEHFSAERVVPAYEAWYQGVLEGRGAGGMGGA